MSYNITSCRATLTHARILKSDIDAILVADKATHGRPLLPGTNFVEVHQHFEPDAEGYVNLRSAEWSGDWSGHCTDFLKEEVLPKVRGRIEFTFTWEAGDFFSGLIVEDGVVTECDVVMTLKPKAVP